MAMPYKSPLARLPRRVKNTKAPRLPPPEYLRLPDGTQVATQDILNKTTNRTSYNLRVGIEYQHRTKRKIAKNIDNHEEE
jgi:hypothetical protein